MHSAAAEDFSFRLTAGYQSNDGFPDYLVDNTDDSGTVDDGLKTRNLAFRGVWTPTLFDTIDLQLGYSEGDMPFGPGSNGQDPGQIIPWEMESTYQYINWQRQLDSNNTIQVLFYHNKLALDASVSYGLFSTEVGVPPSIFYPGAQDFIISYDGDSYNERYDLELRHSGKLTNQLHFSWGAATRRDEAKSQFYFTQNDPIHEHSQRLFANLEAQILQQLTINGGVILEQSGTAGKHHSQRVSANYHLNNHNTLRLGYSNGSKAPSLLQANEYRTLTEAGNTYTIDRMAADNQKEERLEAFEIGYYANLLHNTLSIDIKLFKERNSDLLEDVRDRTYPNIFDTGVNFRDNVIDIETSGVEAQINYTPTQSWLISAQMSNQNINGSYIRKIHPTSTWDLDESAPQRIGNLLIAHDFRHGYAASINYYYQSAVDWQNGGESESFDRLDLRLAKEFTLKSTRLKTELIAHNLLDEDYVDFENYNIFEARYYARITVDF
jgi:iron complex outermembrane receptor protein